MKKILVLGLMLSLFAFGGRKEEVKTTYAAETETSATITGRLSEDTDFRPYANQIVSLKVSNNTSDAPSESAIKITSSNWTNISAYLTEVDGSTIDNKKYDCVLYAEVDKIYANSAFGYLFYGLKTVETIDIEMLDMSQVINMDGFFRECHSLRKIKFSETIDTSSVKNMRCAFYDCRSLTELDLSNFNTSQVTDMSFMFSSCIKLTEIDVSNFDTSNVKDFSCMFQSCIALTNIKGLNSPTFKTSNATNMSSMFNNCKVLTELDLSNFNTSQVTNMGNMFQSCEKLANLDISSFNTSQVTNMENMFRNCPLEKLDLSNFDMSNVTNAGNMIQECDELKYLVAPNNINESTNIELPQMIRIYCGVSTLSSENLAENEVLDITSGKFVSEWRTLRDSNNSICNVLVTGSADNTKFNELLKQYKTFDAETKTKVDNTIDFEGVTIGETIIYLQNVMNGTQSTEKDYGYAKEDSGSFMTLSIKEESPYLVAVISLIGVLSIAGYYFYNKKRNAM